MTCNKDCFNCPYPDCINDELDIDDYQEIDNRNKKLNPPKQRTRDLEKEKARYRAYYIKHREEKKAYNRAHYQANREEICAYQRKQRNGGDGRKEPSLRQRIMEVIQDDALTVREIMERLDTDRIKSVSNTVSFLASAGALVNGGRRYSIESDRTLKTYRKAPATMER